MSISIIIPVFNEEQHVKKSLSKLLNVKFPVPTEYVIIDDASTDKSYKILEILAKKNKKIKLIKNKKNIGKSGSVIWGLNLAKNDILTIHDSDLEYDPNDLLVLYNSLIKLGCNNAIYGSRFLKKETNWIIPLHYLGNIFLSNMLKILYSCNITDMETCYKMFYKKDISDITLKSQKFDFEPEITIKLIKKGIKIHEIPISYFPRKFSEGKKINFIDGFRALKLMIQLR